MKSNYYNLITSIAQKIGGGLIANIVMISACSLMAGFNAPQSIATGFGWAVTVRLRIADEREVKRLNDEVGFLKAQIDRLQRSELLPKPREGEERGESQK